MSPPSTVHVDLSDVRRLPVLGQMTWTPKRRLVAADHVVLPTPVVVGGFGALLVPYDIALTPTDDPRYPGEWCYKVIEPGGHIRHVLVPTVTAGVVVAYSALVDVDPATLIAAATVPPAAAWLVRVAALEAQLAALSAANTELHTWLNDLAARVRALEAGTRPALTYPGAGTYPGTGTYPVAA